MNNEIIIIFLIATVIAVMGLTVLLAVTIVRAISMQAREFTHTTSLHSNTAMNTFHEYAKTHASILANMVDKHTEEKKVSNEIVKQLIEDVMFFKHPETALDLSHAIQARDYVSPPSHSVDSVMQAQARQSPSEGVSAKIENEDDDGASRLDFRDDTQKQADFFAEEFK